MLHTLIKLFLLLVFIIPFTVSCDNHSDDGYNKALAIAAVNQQISDDITIFYGPYAPDYPSHPCKFLSAYIINKETVSELYPENNDTHFIVQKINSENWIVDLIDPNGGEIEYGPYKWKVSMNSNAQKSPRVQWQLYLKDTLSKNKNEHLNNIHVVRMNTDRDYC
ncbi:MAG: hypothetical protein ACJ0BE_06290 [Dehalococcoidia bacterium]